MGVFLGSFSVRQDTQDTEGKGISSDEMTMVEVKTVGMGWVASDFAALWRNVHDTEVAQTAEALSDSDRTAFGSEGGWRLVGVTAISGKKIAYLMSPENRVVDVREGGEFGGSHHVTEIRKKSVSCRNSENESYVLSLYQKRTEVEL